MASASTGPQVVSDHAACAKAPPGAGAVPANASARSRCSQASSWTTTPRPGSEGVGQVGVRVDQGEDVPRLAAGDHQRGHRQPGPVAAGAGRPERHRSAEPTAEAPERVALGLRVEEGVGCRGSSRRERSRARDAQLPLGALNGSGGQLDGAAEVARPGRGSTRCTPRRPCGLGLLRRPPGCPGPRRGRSPRTRSPRSSSSTQAGASVADVPARRCAGRRGPRRSSSATACAGSTTGVPGIGHADPRRPHRAQPLQHRRQVDRVRLGRRLQRVLAPDQRPQRVPPARRPAGRARRSPPELGAAALDQREHLEHAVVHGAGQPGALARRRPPRARPVPRHRAALQQVARGSPRSRPPMTSRKMLP